MYNSTLEESEESSLSTIYSALRFIKILSRSTKERIATIFEPLGARVLVKPLEQENMTASGIVLPETAKEKPQQGTVEAVGSEEEMLTDLAVGDRVLFAKYAGSEIGMNGADYLLLDESEVLARVQEE
jgi:chaperonin GroES